MTIGVIGGMSPETTSAFYLRLVELSRKHGVSYPHMLVDSIPLDFSAEDEIILNGKNQQRLLPFLAASVERLQKTDCIAIPCNTAHIFIDILRRQTTVPILSIVEESLEMIKAKGHRKVGLLATSSTIKSGIYIDKEIEFVSPQEKDQDELAEIIIKIIRTGLKEQDRIHLQKISERLRERCDAILLACTDLQLVLKGDYLDSFTILAEAMFEKFGGEIYDRDH